MKYEYDENTINHQKHGIGFEEAYANSEDISTYVDYNKSKRQNREQKFVNLDLPTWMIERLDKEVKHLGEA